MIPPGRPTPIVNIFEVKLDGAPAHLVCFLEHSDAEKHGIDPRSIVGEFEPAPDQAFDPETFQLNPDFIDILTDYMNLKAATDADLIADARANGGRWLFVLDPRYEGSTETEPPKGDVLGAYAIDESGVLVPDSFRYNDHHEWFSAASGISGVLADRRFYDWLHEESS
jgi:hypothetical protein